LTDTEIHLTGLMVFFVIAPAIFGLGWVYDDLAKRKRAVRLQGLAGLLGLELNPNTSFFGKRWGLLTGIRRGRVVEVFDYSISKTPPPFVVVTARLASDNGLRFTISARTWMDKVDICFGQQRLVTGDVAFDEAWVVRSNRPEFFADAFNPGLRAKLTAARATMVSDARRGAYAGTYTLKSGVVKYEGVGSLGDRKLSVHLPALLDLVCDLAEAAENAPSQFSRQPTANQIPL